MKQKYILGAGPAGLIAAYYNEDYKIVDEKPLGQLNTQFIPGPRLLQSNSRMKWFAKEVMNDLELKIEHCIIGYSDKDGVYDAPNDNFKKQYKKIMEKFSRLITEDFFIMKFLLIFHYKNIDLKKIFNQWQKK